MAKPRRYFVALFALLALCAQPVLAQGEVKGSLDWLIGNWTGGGTSFGSASEARLDVAPALGGKFIEFRYRLTKPMPFEGRALYSKRVNGDWDARWFDSRGVTFPIGASVAGQELTSNWGTAQTERGRTIYRRLPDSKLEVIDTVLAKDGTWREFARQTFTRQTFTRTP